MSDDPQWRIVVVARAEGELKRLPPRDQARVRQALDGLRAGPGTAGLRRLIGRDEWRLRVGNCRVLLRLDFSHRTFVVTRVLPRGRAYRD